MRLFLFCFGGGGLGKPKFGSAINTRTGVEIIPWKQTEIDKDRDWQRLTETERQSETEIDALIGGEERGTSQGVSHDESEHGGFRCTTVDEFTRFSWDWHKPSQRHQTSRKRLITSSLPWIATQSSSTRSHDAITLQLGPIKWLLFN